MTRSEMCMGGNYLAYAVTFANPEVKKIKLIDLLVVDSEGQLVSEGSGYITIGLYEGRISKSKIKDAVRSWVLYELHQLGISTQIVDRDISLKRPPEMEQIRAKIESDRYAFKKDIR